MIASGVESDARLKVRRLGPPFAVQVMLLLAAGVLFAQVVTTLVVLLIPPPRPQVTPLRDIAAALQGGPLTTRFARPLVRRVAVEPPMSPAAFGPQRRRGDARMRSELAQLLGADIQNVRFDSQRGPGAGRWLARGLTPGGGPGRFRGGGLRRPPPDDLYSPPPRQAPPQSLPRAGGGEPGPDPPPAGRLQPPWDADRLVFAGFIAAERQSDGRWVIVESAPEPFPADWQGRILLWLALSLAVVLPAGYLFARRITAPLSAFAEAAERFGKDLKAPPIAQAGPPELNAVALAFNDMQGRLRRYVEDRTAMVGAISHDLRTPLARIRFKLERADDDLRRSISSDVVQMEAMIAAVLDFIRDASAGRPREPLDLVSLLACVVDDAALMGAETSLTSDVAPVVEADAIALQGLFANLVDNAIKYGGCAHVSVEIDGPDVRVRIVDKGPGLPQSELERVFQPFYRADPARNLDVGGIGLGLAVARSVAREHGGDVTLTSGGQGLVAQVQLPLRGSPAS